MSQRVLGIIHEILQEFHNLFGDMSFWKLPNQPLPYEPGVAVFCDVTEALMKTNHFTVCYESNKHPFIKIHRTKDFDI